MQLLPTLCPDRVKTLGACLLWTLCAGSAHAAVNCTATMSAVAFGDVDLVSNTGTSTSGTLSYTCTNDDRNNAVQVNACFLIDGGQGHQNRLNPSYMVDTGNASNQLLFNLYWPDGVTVWTTNGYGFSTPFNPPVFTIDAAPRRSTSSYTGSASMPARLQTNQNSPPNASGYSYQNSYAAGSTAIAWNYSNANQPAPSTCGTNLSIRFPFIVSATVIKSCTVTANTLDFGTPAGFLTTNIDSTTTVQATCSNTTPYQIGLDNGQNFSATRRMAGGSSEFIGYELYRDSGRSSTQRWGSSPSTDTVGDTGTGSAQPAVTIYGRVPPQTTPSPGNYTDTITVIVSY